MKYLIFIFIILSNTLFASQTKNILVVHTYNNSIPWVRNFDNALKDMKDINFFIEYMSIHKLKKIDEKSFVNYLKKKYENIKLDGIIAESHTSSLILQKYNRLIFTDIPQLHLTNFLHDKNLPANIKFAKINRPTAIKKTVKLAFKQNPNAKEVYIIHDKSKASLLSKKTYEDVIKENSKLKINYINHTNSLEEIIKKLSVLPKNSIVLYSLFFKNKNNVSFIPKEFLSKISLKSSVPIYSWVSGFIDAGSIGGYMIDSNLFAKNTIKKLFEFINTKRIDNNKINAVNLFINYDLLEKYDMTNSFIPKEANILNKPIPIWKSNFKELVIVTLVGAILIILIIILVILNRRLKIETKQKIEQQNLLIIQSRMAEIGNMVGAITHQLKQPINTLSMSSANLECKMIMNKEEEIKESTNELIKTVNTQTEFMENTVDNFQNFFKPKDIVNSFDPSICAFKIKDMFKGMFFKYGIDISIEVINSFKIKADENEIMQVFLNIFNNTKDAIVEKNIKNGKIRTNFFVKDKKGIITILDNAGGIPFELLPNKLFNNYVSTKGSEGLGMGLNICKSIIENKYNGKIKVKNTNLGACFTIEFPIDT